MTSIQPKLPIEKGAVEARTPCPAAPHLALLALLSVRPVSEN